MPFERYLTEADIANWPLREDGVIGKCKACKGDMTAADVAAGKIIVKRNGIKRHESCGGPPAPDRPVRHNSDVIAEREAKHGTGQAGAAGNEQGRVIRKGNSLS